MTSVAGIGPDSSRPVLQGQASELRARSERLQQLQGRLQDQERTLLGRSAQLDAQEKDLRGQEQRMRQSSTLNEVCSGGSAAASSSVQTRDRAAAGKCLTICMASDFWTKSR